MPWGTSWRLGGRCLFGRHVRQTPQSTQMEFEQECVASERLEWEGPPSDQDHIHKAADKMERIGSPVLRSIDGVVAPFTPGMSVCNRDHLWPAYGNLLRLSSMAREGA